MASIFTKAARTSLILNILVNPWALLMRTRRSLETLSIQCPCDIYKFGTEIEVISEVTAYFSGLYLPSDVISSKSWWGWKFSIRGTYDQMGKKKPKNKIRIKEQNCKTGSGMGTIALGDFGGWIKCLFLHLGCVTLTLSEKSTHVAKHYLMLSLPLPY